MNFRNQFLLSVSAFSFLLILWIAFHLVRVGHHCLMSPVVKSVSFLDVKDRKQTQFPGCTLSEYFRFWDPIKLNTQYEDILSRVLFLTRAQELNLAPISSKLIIEVSTADPYAFHREQENGQGQVTIGSELVRVEGFLERAILQEWLRGQNSLMGADAFQLEVMSLILWGYLKGRIELLDPFTLEKWDLSVNRNWSRWVISEKDYCYSSWVALSHWESCRHRISQAGSPDGIEGPQSMVGTDSVSDSSDAFHSHRVVEKMALAPLVAGLIWNRYQMDNFREKIEFWRSWKTSWSAESIFLRSSVPDLISPNTFHEVFKWISFVTKRYWSTIGHTDFGKQEEQALLNQKFDFFIKGDHLPHRKLDELTQFSKLNIQTSLVIRDGSQVYLEGMRKVGLKMGNLPVSYRIYSTCGKITQDQLQQEKTDKLMVVDFCQQENLKVHWLSLKSGGWKSFMTSNQNLKFMLFHLPSLKKVTPFTESFGLDYDGLTLLSEKLRWGQKKWLRKLGVFQPLGIWDAVIYYRL